MKVDLISKNADDTMHLGAFMGEHLGPGDIIGMTGDLGSGKTCLTRGIARGMGVSDTYGITSPTFTLINEYPGRIPLYHLDVYRLSGSEDLEDLGYEEYFFGRGVTVIEWAEKIDDVIPSDAIFIDITFLDETRRAISVSSTGQSGIHLVTKIGEEVFNEWH